MGCLDFRPTKGAPTHKKMTPKTNRTIETRETIDQICSTPDSIISVYSLEKHVWAHSNSRAARKARQPELKTIEEFQINPARPFLNDILRNMAAPYHPNRKENPIGQGYWIQAEFGSGKSHLLCFLASLALGNITAWEMVKQKEKQAGRGKRESLHRFWRKGLEAKSRTGKGVLVVVATLVGAGGGTVGIHDKGRRLTEYILDAAKAQIEIEMGQNISFYPSELLADRFLSQDLDRYRHDLKKFLQDPRFFEADETEDIDDFIRAIQPDQSVVDKQARGAKLWRFYTEYLRVHPQIEAETEDILKHFVQTLLDHGYNGVLLVLDEVSLFLQNRDAHQRSDDEKTLVVLANRLAKVHNLPIWTVCAAQEALESKTGAKNIIANDRLKWVELLEKDQDYYDIVLSRVRTITNPAAIAAYYGFYKRGFSWPNSITQDEFARFFPFHKPALEVLKAITFELATSRSAIHFMHQTLKSQIKNQGSHIIRLWELFDEATLNQEDPSGVNPGLSAIKTKREGDYRAYQACKRQIQGLTKGPLKVHWDKAIKIIQTLFLYYIAKTRQQGVAPEETANNVLIERDAQANVEENIHHYEILTDHLARELNQIVLNPDANGAPRHRFDPVLTGVDPRQAFQKARDEAEADHTLVQAAWDHLLSLDEWTVRAHHINIDLSGGVRSLFRAIAAANGPMYTTLTLIWRGRQISGRVGMCDLGPIASQKTRLPPIHSDQTDLDFQVIVGKKPLEQPLIQKILVGHGDPRLILWTPGELTPEEHNRLIDFTAFKKLVNDWQGQQRDDASAVITWIANALQANLAGIAKIITTSYGRGRMDARDHSQIPFKTLGELPTILTPVVDRVLSSFYVSKTIRFQPPLEFRKETGVKVINGIVKTGEIPPGAKPNPNISAARNFGFGLKIMSKGADRVLDVSDNLFVWELWNFIDDKLVDAGQVMNIQTLYKNFMGVGGPRDYGLTRRMVDIFLLCLVQTGKIRITMGPQAGVSDNRLDSANIASVDFSVKVLNAMQTVQKVARSANGDLWHDDVINTVDACARQIQKLLQSDDLKALKMLENLKVFAPPTAHAIEIQLTQCIQDLFVCPSPHSVETEPRGESLHECGLSFAKNVKKTKPAQKALYQAIRIFEDGVNAKMNLFLTPRVRERLKQGRNEPVIGDILACEDVKRVRDVLVQACLKDKGITDIIGRYLKGVTVVTVKLSDFKPSADLFEKERISELTREFRQFLENSVKDIEDDDILMMIEN